jgi:hypothetical protein
MGERMASPMGRVIERFPELAQAIRNAFHADPSFREMCDDYAEALDALQRWQASGDPQRPARIEEYQELATALESEIVAALEVSSHTTADLT